jgi:peptide/nickel transport system permease protein
VIIRKLASNCFRASCTLLGVWVFVQSLPRLLPEDPARIAAGEWATDAEVQALRQVLRLDQPWFRALRISGLEWLRGGFGQSLRYRKPVSELLRQGFPISFKLACFAMLLAALLAWSLALWRGRSSRALQALAIASPVYVLGPLMLWGIAQHIPGLPVSGIQGWAAWILPTIALAVPLAGHQARLLTTQLESLRDSYGLRWSRGSGVPLTVAWRRWLLPAVSGPWLTVLGLQLGGLLGGAVLVESIFSIPGLGQILVGALNTRDLPLVQATVFLGAALYVFTQLIVEYLQAVLDPRLR